MMALHSARWETRGTASHLWFGWRIFVFTASFSFNLSSTWFLSTSFWTKREKLIETLQHHNLKWVSRWQKSSWCTLHNHYHDIPALVPSAFATLLDFVFNLLDLTRGGWFALVVSSTSSLASSSSLAKASTHAMNGLTETAKRFFVGVVHSVTCPPKRTWQRSVSDRFVSWSFRSKYKFFCSEPEICLIDSFFYPTKERNNSVFGTRRQ